MRRYTIEVDGRSFAVDVDDQGIDRFAVVVDGQAFDVALAGSEELAGDSAVRIVPAAAAAPVAGGSPPVRRPVTAPSAAPGAGGGGTLTAPMPGVILRVLVAAGAHVQRGQDVAVLDAMKMENIIRAPSEGTVTEICVQPGQQVAHGQVIVRLQAEAP
jgi:biotin carboxyl carrier protein